MDPDFRRSFRPCLTETTAITDVHEGGLSWRALHSWASFGPLARKKFVFIVKKNFSFSFFFSSQLNATCNLISCERMFGPTALPHFRVEKHRSRGPGRLQGQEAQAQYEAHIHREGGRRHGRYHSRCGSSSPGVFSNICPPAVQGSLTQFIIISVCCVSFAHHFLFVAKDQ